jgi:hypothetical protein
MLQRISLDGDNLEAFENRLEVLTAVFLNLNIA